MPELWALESDVKTNVLNLSLNPQWFWRQSSQRATILSKSMLELRALHSDTNADEDAGHTILRALFCQNAMKNMACWCEFKYPVNKLITGVV
jgi:hypothetical protein